MRKERPPKVFSVYLMANGTRSVLYTGVTSNLPRRVIEHKDGLVPGFTSRYGVTRLVYYELLATADEAIRWEKQIKGGSRQDKLDLIEGKNPEWRDLSEELGVGGSTAKKAPPGVPGRKRPAHRGHIARIASSGTPRNDGKREE